MTAPSESHDAVRVAFVCEVMKSIPLMSLPSLPVSFNFAPLIQATASANTMCAFAMPHVMPPARAWVGVEHAVDRRAGMIRVGWLPVLDDDI